MQSMRYPGHADVKTGVAEMISRWNEIDRQDEEAAQVFQETEEGWRMAA